MAERPEAGASQLAGVSRNRRRARLVRKVDAPMKRLGEVMKAWRKSRDMGLRDACKEVGGVSAATLSRIERGQAMEAKTLAAVLRFLLGEV